MSAAWAIAGGLYFLGMFLMGMILADVLDQTRHRKPVPWNVRAIVMVLLWPLVPPVVVLRLLAYWWVES